MLPRVRAVLLRLQFEGHPDLAEVDVRKMGNYWLKVTGDSLMLDGGIPAHMVNGQGRWRLHASDPPEMVYKYLRPRDQAQDFGPVIRFLAASVNQP